jgi:hypothetical protein
MDRLGPHEDPSGAVAMEQEMNRSDPRLAAVEATDVRFNYVRKTWQRAQLHAAPPFRSVVQYFDSFDGLRPVTTTARGLAGRVQRVTFSTSSLTPHLPRYVVVRASSLGSYLPWGTTQALPVDPAARGTRGLEFAETNPLESSHVPAARWGGEVHVHPAVDDLQTVGGAFVDVQAMDAMSDRHITALLEHAHYEWLPRDGAVYGSIPGIVGVYASEPTQELAYAQLKKVLRAWIKLRASLGLPIPSAIG